jgi:1,2-diacylglycerol 3-beta-galactosyltransferase
VPSPSPQLRRETAAERRILVLTSDTGAGHRSVSNALAAAARRRDGEPFDLIQVDPLAPLSGTLRPSSTDETPTPFDRIVKLYGPVIRRSPWLWGWGFRLLDNEPGLRAYLAFLSRRFQERIEEAVVQIEPEAIVSVHPLVNHLMVRARERLHRPALPLLTVLTDLVSIHHWWAAKGIDQYVGSSEVAAARLIELGISPSRIAVLGIPIRPEFDQMTSSAREMRTRLQLEPDLPMVLLMGGGEGAGRLPQIAQALSEVGRRGVRFQMVILAGRNAQARTHLEAQSWSVPVRVLSFTENVAEYMTAADVIATKPGSLTVSEALALARPLLLGRPLPGQEEGNIGYVVEAGAGLAYRTPKEAALAAEHLLSDPAARWEMGQQAARLSHPRAAERTLDLLQGMLLRVDTGR